MSLAYIALICALVLLALAAFWVVALQDQVAGLVKERDAEVAAQAGGDVGQFQSGHAGHPDIRHHHVNSGASSMRASASGPFSAWRTT